MTDTPSLDTYLGGQTLSEAFHDLTPQQINDMSLSEFAVRTGRPTPIQAASHRSTCRMLPFVVLA